MEKQVVVMNETGLHARPAAVFVQTAKKYECNILIDKEGKRVNAKSIMGILSLGVSQGTRISIIANGSDENQAITELVTLVEDNFSER
jgi:phosphotransferase system HPr (HPr) family protein